MDKCKYKFRFILGYSLVMMVLFSLCGKDLVVDTLEIEMNADTFFKASYNARLYQQSYAVENLTQQDIQGRINEIKFLTDIFEDRINKIATLFETASRESAVRNISFANMISTEFMGIPENLDIEKRKVAKDLLHEESDLGSVYFTLPNGDVYLGEPYSDQVQLPRLNYADRDWYKGVVNTNDTYISSVFTSASIHVPAIAIAVPVYQDNHNMTLLGYWVGIIDISKVWKSIKDNYVPVEEELIVVDHEGTEIFNSGKYDYSDIRISPLFSANVNTSVIHDNRATLKILEGNLLTVSYPIHVRSHVWIVTTIKQYIV